MSKNRRYEELDVAKIVLDKSNPRIAKWMEIYGDNITAEQMSLALGAASPDGDERGPTFRSLRESIKTNRGIIHPIIVSKDSKKKTHTVIEGNTRALIYREFVANQVPGSWKKIPAIVYDGLSPAEIDAIRLQAHLVGPREWDPYSKAKYLDYLSTCEHLTIDQIVDFCGGKKNEVLSYIDAYKDMEKYYRPLLKSDDEFDPTRFSAFVELQRKRIQDSLLRHRYTKTDFSSWVLKGKFSPLNTVRQLPNILDNEKSKEVFLKHDATDAIKMLDVPNADIALKEASILALSRELLVKLNSLPHAEFRRLHKELDKEKEKELLIEAGTALRQLIDDLSSEGE